MPYAIIRHKIADFEKWKPEFDKHGEVRRSSGIHGGYLFRNSDDPQELLILFEVDDLEKSREFTQSDNLKQAMQKAGVVDKPDFYFLELIEKLPE